MKKIIFVSLWLSILVFAYSAENLILDVLFTNDIHGGIDAYDATFMNPEFPPRLGGGGSAARYIKDVRSLTNGKTRDNLLIDVGDFFQGHPVGTMSDGTAVIDYFNLVGYDLSVIGNHEYDIGEERLKKTYKRAKFPILSCNIINKKTGKLVDYAKPYIIFEKMGIRIAVIGLTTTDTALMSFPDNIKNVQFLPAVPQLKKYIKIVKQKENADIVIVAGHMGLPYFPQEAYDKRYSEDSKPIKERKWGYDAQEIAHEVEGIDVFFGGHMHKGFPSAWEDPLTHTLVFQSYAYGSSIGHVKLLIDPETKTLVGYKPPSVSEREGVLVTLFEDRFIPVPVIADTILTLQKIAEKGMDQVIGVADTYISKNGNGPQNLIGNLVCEAMLQFDDADFSFMNLGGIRGEINRGPITYRDVFNVMPFDNQIVTFEVDGKFLKDIIEMRVSGSRAGLRTAGIKVVVNRTRPDYDRISELYIGGEPWQADKIYRVTTTDFLLQGNAGLTMLTTIPQDKITRYETELRNVIVDYIRLNSPVTAKIDDRWKRDDRSKKSESILQELDK